MIRKVVLLYPKARRYTGFLSTHKLPGLVTAHSGLTILKQILERRGVRVVVHDEQITPFYDSLIVKLTVYGFTWREAVDRMARALNGFLIIGVKTTIPYFQQKQAQMSGAPAGK